RQPKLRRGQPFVRPCPAGSNLRATCPHRLAVRTVRCADLRQEPRARRNELRNHPLNQLVPVGVPPQAGPTPELEVVGEAEVTVPCAVPPGRRPQTSERGRDEPSPRTSGLRLGPSARLPASFRSSASRHTGRWLAATPRKLAVSISRARLAIVTGQT